MSDKPKFDDDESAMYFKLVAFVDAVHGVVEATSRDLVKGKCVYSDATLQALGELAKRFKPVENLLDRVQQNGQNYN